jgi:hypothetical protein
VRLPDEVRQVTADFLALTGAKATSISPRCWPSGGRGSTQARETIAFTTMAIEASLALGP